MVDNVNTEKGLRTIALDPTTYKVYLIGNLEGKNKTNCSGVMILDKQKTI